jgi:hypothetical protein
VDVKKTVVILVAVALLSLLLAGCAPGPNSLTGSAGPQGKAAGFWLGLWHGLIAPVTFIISLFSDRVEMFEVHNNGGWYSFGFLLGMMILLGGGGGGAARRRNRG